MWDLAIYPTFRFIRNYGGEMHQFDYCKWICVFLYILFKKKILTHFPTSSF